MVAGQIDAYLIVDQFAPAVCQDLMPLPPVKAAYHRTVAVQAAQELSRFSLQDTIRCLSLQVDLDSTWDGLIVALDSPDSWQIRDSIDQRHPCREMIRRRFVANPGGEFEARRLFSSVCYRPIPMWNGSLLSKYLPIYFDVKYFDIKRLI